MTLSFINIELQKSSKKYFHFDLKVLAIFYDLINCNLYFNEGENRNSESMKKIDPVAKLFHITSALLFC